MNFKTIVMATVLSALMPLASAFAAESMPMDHAATAPAAATHDMSKMDMKTPASKTTAHASKKTSHQHLAKAKHHKHHAAMSAKAHKTVAKVKAEKTASTATPDVKAS
jgi:hypothetical protein